MQGRFRWFFGAVAVTLLAGACSASGGTPAPSGPDGTPVGTAPAANAAEFPGADWATTPPAEAGYAVSDLDGFATKAQAGGSNCLVVTRHGKLVAEWYWNESTPMGTQEVFSATKSYASTLVGIAQHEGKLRIEDKASAYIPEWVGTASEDVTIRNLLSNDSGRHWDFQTDYLKLTGAADKDAQAVSLGQDVPPETKWVYNNSAIQTLDVVLKKATGEDTAAYAQRVLLDPIGMTRSKMTHDQSGNSTNVYAGLQSNCRDMARFGLLFLHKGNWAGKQVVPSEWVDEATTTSQPLNAAYGYLWWLNRKGLIQGAGQAQGAAGQGTPAPADTEARAERQLVNDSPEDMFWALGLGGQIIQVDRSSDTVIVRLGGVRTPAGAEAFGPVQMAAMAALVR